MMIKGIIFDLDGTTLSTLEDIRDSLNMVLESHDYPLRTYEDVRLGVGNGSHHLIKVSLPEGTEEETINEILQEYVGTYAEHYNHKTHPYEGIIELLKELQEKGILLAINSNKPEAITRKLIAESFPHIKFTEVTGQRNDIPRKPDPASALHILKQMKLDKTEVLYIGDSETDVATAHNAGLKVIGCLWGFRDRATLERCQADFLAEQPSDILKIIGENQ